MAARGNEGRPPGVGVRLRAAALALGLLAVAIVCGSGPALAWPLSAESVAVRSDLAATVATDAATVAGQIAAGHAYDKHVVGERQFPGVASRAAFAALIQGIIEHPTEKRRLSHDRTAYWDAGSGAVVIANPHDRDGGTCFKPRAGRAYFDNLH
jgi:filamentous hemagglutinin